MDPQRLQRYADGFNASATLKHFGVRLSFVGEQVRVELDPIRPEQRGGMGTEAVNGGILAAVFDLAIGCTSALVDPSRRSATIQLSMSFMRAVRGSRLFALAKVERMGGATLFASATIYDEHEVACASCQGVVRVSELPWASGEHPGIN